VTLERRALWSEALAVMGLSPESADRGVVRYVHTWAPLRLEVCVGQLDPLLPVEIRVEGPRQPGDFLLLPRHSALLPPATLTGERAFDEAVAIVIGEGVLLARLGWRERRAVQEALALGAQLDASGAWLPAQATAAFASAGEIREAVEVLGRAVLALRQPSLEELLQRCMSGPDIPLVDRAIEGLMKDALRTLPTGLLGPVTELLLRDPQLQELPDDLVERAVGLWKNRQGEGLIDVLCVVLRRRGPARAFHQLWSRLAVRLDPLVCGRVLRTVLEQDPRPWTEHVLRVATPAQTPIRTGPRLSLRGREVLLLAVVQRCRGDWLELLLSLHAHNATDARQLSELLLWLDDARVPSRMMELLTLHREAVSSLLAERARRAIRLDSTAELSPVLKLLDDPLCEVLLELPDEALGWLVTLAPRSEELRLRWVARLARAPGPAAEQGLLTWLDMGSVRVRRAVAQALGSVGGPRALESLEALTRSWLVDSELRAVAQASATAIRARHAQGGLSLARGEEGRLSPSSEPGEW
jgi:hypothetical protein